MPKKRKKEKMKWNWVIILLQASKFRLKTATVYYKVGNAFLQFETKRKQKSNNIVLLFDINLYFFPLHFHYFQNRANFPITWFHVKLQMVNFNFLKTIFHNIFLWMKWICILTLKYIYLHNSFTKQNSSWMNQLKL